MFDWKQQKNAAIYISRPPSTNKEEKLPEAVANLMLETVESSQTEVSNGGKKRWQFNDSECGCCTGSKPATS